MPKLGLDFRLERLVGQLGGIAAPAPGPRRSWVSWAISVGCARRWIRTPALVAGTLGTLEGIGVQAQDVRDHGEQRRWIKALIGCPTCLR
jgi:hypothetical protein